MLHQLSCLALGVSIASAGLALVPTEAHACGGFFCNSAQPVNQAAERIIFAQDGEGAVTAVIQIQYAGEAEQFAWMLPVVGTPEVSVSSNAAFDRLQQASNPFYQLNTTFEGFCSGGSRRGGGGISLDGAGADAGIAGPGPEEPVTVLDEGSVGPYDFVVISIDASTPDLAAEALMWLRDNGYDVTDFGGDLLRLYLEQDMNLLAFRLTKGNDAGAIRPVRLSFGVGLPSIPIRPTAVAASDDMGVMVWVLGEHRAIPANYRSLELNDALLNWISPNSNYNDVVTRAANEAGGQGFVTEFAGAAAPLGESIFGSSEEEQWVTLTTTDWTGREGELLSRLQGFSFLDGMRDLFKAHLPRPLDIPEDAFLACVSCYIDYSTSDIVGFEPALFIEEAQAAVIDPMIETRALFEDAPYVTRLYTTMSADEMTMDPVFDFNADLGDYDNNHVADRVVECSPSLTRAEAPWRITLPDGNVIRGTGNTWPFATDSEDMPANSRIRRIGTTGSGEVVTDNTAGIRAALVTHNETIPTSGGGCSVSSSDNLGSRASLFGLVGLVSLALVGRSRRRLPRQGTRGR